MPIEVGGIVIGRAIILTGPNISGSCVHKVPADQVVLIAVTIVINTVKVAGIQHPDGIPLQFDGMPVAIGVLPQILPDIAQQVFMVPIDTSVNDGHNDGRVALCAIPGRFGGYPGELELLTVEWVIGYHIQE